MPAKEKKRGGPPTKLDPEMKSKLEYIYQLDPTIPEICYYCQISRQTIYNWKENEPEFFDWLEGLRERPVVIARQTVIKNLERNPQLAMDYLSRKRKGEFSQRQESTGADGSPLFEKATFAINPPADGQNV